MRSVKISKEELFSIPEGIFKINASAGTGKTYTLIERYKELMKKNIKPADILMVTFTNNSAEEIKTRLINSYKDLKEKNVKLSDLMNSPVMTFHAFCSRLLKKEGLNAPAYLKINEFIPDRFSILEDSKIESDMFSEFYSRFKRNNIKEYSDLFEIADKSTGNILKIIKKLCSIGIFPADKKFSPEDETYLKGNYDEYSKVFDEMNVPAYGKIGEINNELYNCFKSKLDSGIFIDLQFEKIKNSENPKTINPECKNTIFEDPLQLKWIEFLGKLYWEYILFLVKRNYLNYEFMVMFAFLVLINDSGARERNKFKYVMVDEFQDTDEIQFKIILLLAGKKDPDKLFLNLCVVGDWKQGIYGFRNADIENIISFEDRLEILTTELNKKNADIIVPDKIYSLDLVENRRSSKKILNAAIETLNIPATKDEEVPPAGEIELIEINQFKDNSEICLLKGSDKKDEQELILKKITEIISNEKYLIHEFNADGSVLLTRRVELNDIAVLCRDNKFALDLYRMAVNKYKIPAKLSGGIELFTSYPAVILLGWLRILNDPKEINGWFAILDNEEVPLTHIEEMMKKLAKGDLSVLPEKLIEIYQKLCKINDVTNICQAVMGFYDLKDNFSNKIITIIDSWLSINNYSLSSLVRLIENNILTTYNVEIISSEDSFTIQTIHGSKGLEYPVVFVANLNASNFPSSRGETDMIVFNPVAGLRVKKVFGERNNKYYEFNNWRSTLILSMFRISYNEERRLFYVAVTRAKQYLYLTSSKSSNFYSHWKEFNEICISDLSHVSPEKLDSAPQAIHDLPQIDPSDIVWSE
ncbi:hypothetical protein BH10BAC5_BH10BAC5_24520 [soil metagenome]